MKINWKTGDPPKISDGHVHFVYYLVSYAPIDDMSRPIVNMAVWTNKNPHWFRDRNEVGEWHWDNLNLYYRVVAWHELPDPYDPYEENSDEEEKNE